MSWVSGPMGLPTSLRRRNPAEAGFCTLLSVGKLKAASPDRGAYRF